MKSDHLEDSERASSARIRPPRPKYQVFVSSTFQDLHEERETVTWEILKAGHIPVGMENFSAYDDRGWKVIDRTLQTTDYYVLILAGRYGTIDDALGVSWTEREYQRAIELGIPVLAFIREKKYITGEKLDIDEKAKNLAALVENVSKNRLREIWTTSDDLRARVSSALMKAILEDEADGNPRPGWYRGNQLPSPATIDELARLSSENRQLREKLSSPKHRAETMVIPYIEVTNTGGQMDGMHGIYCTVQNQGETPFRLTGEEASWWFIARSGAASTAPKPAEVRVRQRFAKPGEKCEVSILLPLNKEETSAFSASLTKDPYTSPIASRLVVTCENTAGSRKIEEQTLRFPVPRRPTAT
jgi:hypothetical protein